MSADTTPTNQKLESPPLILAPGVVLHDRWRLDRCVASGGYGDVWSAQDLDEDERTVAIKILRTDAGNNDPSALARMRLEAEILVRVEHPNIVKVYGFYEGSYGPFVVMELLEGHAIDQVLRTHGPADPDALAPVVHQLLLALQAAHDQKVLHRDLKPENIILEERPDGARVPKLIDFGIAKTESPFGGSDDSGLTMVQTRAGGFMGTPRYSAPEQVVGDPIGPSADIFSLGLVIAEWLSGRARLDSEQHSEVMSKLLSPHEFELDDIPYRWRKWVAKCVAKQPGDRFQSANEAVAKLEAWVVKEGKPADFLDDGYFPGGEQAASEGSNFVGREHGPLELDLDRVAQAPSRPRTSTPMFDAEKPRGTPPLGTQPPPQKAAKAQGDVSHLIQTKRDDEEGVLDYLYLSAVFIICFALTFFGLTWLTGGF